MTGYFTELFQYDFMRRAFLAILIITPLLGILGTMIVHKKMAYFSDALGHSALTGIAIGVVCGISDTNLSMVLFAIVFAFLLNQINRKNLAAIRYHHFCFCQLQYGDRSGNPIQGGQF